MGSDREAVEIFQTARDAAFADDSELAKTSRDVGIQASRDLICLLSTQGKVSESLKAAYALVESVSDSPVDYAKALYGVAELHYEAGQFKSVRDVAERHLSDLANSPELTTPIRKILVATHYRLKEYDPGLTLENQLRKERAYSRDEERRLASLRAYTRLNRCEYAKALGEFQALLRDYGHRDAERQRIQGVIDKLADVVKH